MLRIPDWRQGGGVIPDVMDDVLLPERQIPESVVNFSFIFGCYKCVPAVDSGGGCWWWWCMGVFFIVQI